MGIQSGEIEYRLKHPCQIITEDGSKEWHIAILREPTNQHAKYYLRIEDMIGKAMLDAQKALGREDDEQNLAGEEVTPLHKADTKDYEATAREHVVGLKMLLINSDRVSTADFRKVFASLALKQTDSAIISCNGEYRLKSSYWNALSLKDQLGMAYLWSAFFVMPSLEET